MERRHESNATGKSTPQARPSEPFQIEAMTPADKSAVLELARSLTRYFPEDIIDVIDSSLKKRSVLVGKLGNEVVAFLVYACRDSQTAEIIWMGVDEKYHGLGLGTLILENLEELLEAEGIKKLIASTLSYTVQYKPFEKVRQFYYRRGFSSLGIQNNYYQDGMDRLILVKTLY
jgi:ribosomal protein S18 acetylase RimI-like enzyme